MNSLQKIIRHLYFDYALVAVLLCINTALIIGDFNVRLANTSSDVSPVAFSYYLNNPENFMSDMLMKTQVPSFLGSMQNWLPFLLHHYFAFPPEIAAFVLVYLQNVLLGLAMFQLALTITKRNDIAWLSLLFLVAFRPHWWNLALYGDLEWMPYAGHLALPFLIYAFSFAIEQRFYVMVFFLILGAFFHPGLTLFALAMIGVHQLWIWVKKQISSSDFYLRVLLLALVLVVCVVPVKIATWGLKEVSSDQVISILMQNGHTVPWANPSCTYCLNGFIRSLLVLPLLFGFAWLAIRKLIVDQDASLFWKTSLLTCIALCLLHPLVLKLQFIPVIRLLTFRSTELMIVLSLPFMMAYLVEKFLAGNLLTRLLIACLLLLPSTILMLAVWIILVTAEFSEVVELRNQRFYRQISHLLAFGICGLLFLLSIPFFSQQVYPVVSPILNSPLNISTIPYLGNMKYLLIVIAVVYLSILANFAANGNNQGGNLVAKFLIFKKSKYNNLSEDVAGLMKDSHIYQLIMIPLLIVLTWYLLTSNYQYGINATSGEARAYYEVQAWARSSTPVNAGFIQTGTSVYDGWRSISQRPVVAPFEIAGYYFYSQDAWQYRERLVDFFSEYCDFNSEPYRSYGGPYECYKSLDEAGILRFSKSFGADYLVRRASDPRLQFPIAYQSDFYVVYKLDEKK